MGLITRTGSSKRAYTRKEDELIVKLANEQKPVSEIALAVKRTDASVQYRIYRVLNKVAKFEDIKYKAV